MTITHWLACLLVTATASAAAAQTLGEVARAEQERRKSAGKAGKVYTNESLRPEPPPSVPAGLPPMGTAASLGALASGPSAPAGSPGAAAGSDATTPSQAAATGSSTTASTLPTTEAGWRGRAAELRANVVRQQVLADALQSRINAAMLDFVNRDDPAQRSVIEQDRNRALAELDRVKLDLKSAQQAVGDLEEQARRASVPAGWLR